MEQNKRKALENELLSKLNLDVLPTGGYLTCEKAITYLFEDKKENFFWGKSSYFDEYVSIDFFDFIGSNKEIIIDYAIMHPEISYDLLYWLVITKLCKPKDFKNYTKEQVCQIPRTMREVIANPADKYKLHFEQLVTNDTLYYSITDENKWNALEWVAKNYPNKLNLFACNTTPANPLNKKDILEHYKTIEDKSQLPESLQKLLSILQKQYEEKLERQKMLAEKRKQRAREKLMNWYDSNGNLLKLFELEDGVEIKTLDDYKLILSYFIKSKLSTSEFCKQYLIDNIKGFELMCTKFALMDSEFNTYYTELKNAKQNTTLNAVKNILSEDNANVENLINSTTLTLPTIIDASKSMVQPTSINSFARKVVDFYHTKLNSYNPTSSNKEEILKRLTEQEISFLLTNKTYHRLKSDKLLYLGTDFVNTFKPLNDLGQKTRKQMQEPENGVKSLLDTYNKRFYPNQVFCNHLQIIMPDGTTKPVDQDTINMATSFANTHKLYKSSSTILQIIKAIADGEIENKEETQQFLTFTKKRDEQCSTLEGHMNYYTELSM